MDETSLTLSRFTRGVNYLDFCAVAVPSGLSADNLPLSIQFVAGPGHENRLLWLGQLFETLRGPFPEPDLSGVVPT